MSFNPNKPQNGDPMDADLIRAQLNALKQIAESAPQGPPGPAGPPGPSNIYVQEDDPGGSDGDFWLRPSDGEVFRRENGSWSDKGSIKGATGETGPIGPKGDTGDKGDPGDKGDTGDVNAQQLSDAMTSVTNNSSANSNGVTTLDPNSFSDPDDQTLANKFNELVNALRR